MTLNNGLVIKKGGLVVGTIPKNDQGKVADTPNDGDVIMGGNLFVGTGDGAGTGNINAGGSIGGASLYASGGADSTALSTLNGQTRIWNGYMYGTNTPYTGTKLPATPAY